MKKLLLVASLFISAVSFSQSVVDRANPANTVADYRLMAKYNQFIPRYADTATANTKIGIDSAGAVIYTYDIKGFWYRQNSPKKWVRLVSDNLLSNNFFYDSTCNCYKIDTSAIINIINTFNADSSIASISIINDSTVRICFSNGSCVNIGIVTHLTNITNVYWIGGDSISVCKFDTTAGVVTQTCDTIELGIHSSANIYQNWLRNAGSNIIEFGSDSPNSSPGLFLAHSTYANTGYNKMNFQGYTIYDYPINFQQQQAFQNSTAIASFHHDDNVGNKVKLGVNYTSNPYQASPLINGYFGTRIGYFLGTNATGVGSYGVRYDDSTAKTVGLFFHTNDTTYTDAITIYGVPRRPVGSFPFLNAQLSNYKIATFGTDGLVKFNQYNSSNFYISDTGRYKVAVIDTLDGTIKKGHWIGGTNLWTDGGGFIYVTDSSNNVVIGGTSDDGSRLRVIGDVRFDLGSDSTGDMLYRSADGTLDRIPIGSSNYILRVVGGVPVWTPDSVGVAVSWTAVTGKPNSGNFIYNQTASFQSSASYRIDGYGIVQSQIKIGDNYTLGNGYDFEINRASASENMRLVNDNTSGSSEFYVVNSGGTTGLRLGYYGSTYSTSGMQQANRATLFGINTSGLNIGMYTSAPVDFYTNNTKQMTVGSTGNITVTNLASGSTAPTTTGTTKMVITDANGLLSFTTIPTGGFTTADNGLTASTSTNVQLGGTLLQNTTVNAAGFTTTFTGTIDGSAVPLFLINNSTTSGGIALKVTNSSPSQAAILVSGNAYGISSSSTNTAVYAIGNIGVQAESVNGTALFADVSPSSTNTVVKVAALERGTSGTAANGIGGSIDLNLYNTTSGDATANQLIWKWTDAAFATRTSQFIITGVDAGTTRTLGTFDGNGAVTFPGNGNPSTTLTVNATSGVGIQAVSTGSVGVLGYSTATYGVESTNNLSSTNTVAGTFYIQRRSTGTAASGIGASIDFSVDNAGGSGDISNKIISSWIDATNATRTSQFKVTGVLSGSAVDVFTANSDGSWQIRPITATAASAITPAEGMMLFVSNTNGTFTSIGFWGYQNGAWHAF